MSYAVQRPDLRVIAVLLGLAQQSGRRYVYPSQAWIVKHLRAWQGRTMCRRTLGYHLVALEKSGWLRRQRRHRAGAGGMEFHSSLYVIGQRAWSWLSRLRGGSAKPSAKPLRASPAPSPAPAPAPGSIRIPSRPPPEFYEALARIRPRTRR